MRTKKIGFIVEGDVDRLIVEILAHRILPKGFDFHTVRLGGIAALSSAYTTVLLFLDKGYRHTILVFDTDSAIEVNYSWRVQMLEDSFETYGVLEQTTICTAVPTIEAWLLAEYEADPEQVANPKVALAGHLGVQNLTLEMIGEVAERLDIEKARRRSESFDRFVGVLHKVERSILKEDKVVATV
jgi:hypothetical protein